MISASSATVWFVIIGLAVATYLIRFSFLGLLDGEKMPLWMERHLKFVGVAVMPGIAAPAVFWPEATGGEPDLARLLAAAAALGIGIWRRSVLASVLAGLITLYAGLFLLP
jgi:branched-subunit amino acid transport protein